MPTFSRVAPSIFVSDIQQAIAFYQDALGFSLECVDDPARRAVMVDGNAVLHLDLDHAKAGSSSTHMMVNGLSALRDRLVMKKANIIQQPSDQEWGLREMVVADPDKNLFELAEPVRRDPAA